MKVLSIEDHPLVSGALASLLRQQHTDLEFFSVESLGELKSFFDSHKDIDLIFVDLNIGEKVVGPEILEDLKSWNIAAPKIVLSMHSEAFLVKKSLQAGALGYVCKVDPPQEIFQAIQSVLSGELYLSRSCRHIDLDAPVDVLTQRELEIAQRIATGQSSKEIAAALFISPRTVDTHRTNLLKKLRLKNSAELAGYLYKHYGFS